MNDQRLFDLAMKVIAHQATAAERAELDQLLAHDSELRKEFAHLQADVRLAKETLPLVEATQAHAGELPAYARERLQTKVRQTLGRPAAESPGTRGLSWSWRWAFGLAVAAAMVMLFAIKPAEDTFILQVAMLDTLGDTRGAGTNDLTVLQGVWSSAAVQRFTSVSELSSWESQPPANGAQSYAKVIYDRAAGEVRVTGRMRGASFEETVPVETTLLDALREVEEFIRTQAPTGR